MSDSDQTYKLELKDASTGRYRHVPICEACYQMFQVNKAK